MARSVLIAGDSNLKQLVGLMSASVLCVPGARIVNDRKFFQEQLSQRLTTDLPELVVLHLGSNDAGDKVSDLLVRNYRKILDSVFEALPSVSIGVTEVLPRRWNGYVGERANRKLSGIQENICQLNVRLRAMTKEYRDCRFIEYGAMFDPDSHLAVDGLHVNRAGALVLKDVLESSIACRGETVSEAIETHVLSPVPAELGKLSYADVVRFFPPRAVLHSQNHSKTQEKEDKPPVFETFFRQQNILLIKTRAMKDHIGAEWAQNTLNRAVTVGQNVYQRAFSRKVDWPESIESKTPNDSIDLDSSTYTSVDDAFSTILQFMSQTSRQCKRYYDTNREAVTQGCDAQHCNRFHSPQYSTVQNKNPLQRTEDVHVVVQPGTYAVTAGAWGHGQQQKHVVHVHDGQSVDLDFCL